MGGGASTNSRETYDSKERLDESKCKELSGRKFDKEVFEAYTDETGTVSPFVAEVMEGTDCFLTHAWGKDLLGRDNHERVSRINSELKKRGVSVWFDSERMIGNIVAQMCHGIDTTKLVIVCITKTYLDKVNSGNAADNCLKEFNYADLKKSSANMIAVVMEPGVKNTKDWVGPVAMALGGSLYVDLSSDEKFSEGCQHLYETITKMLGTPPHHVKEHVVSTSQKTLCTLTAISKLLESSKFTDAITAPPAVESKALTLLTSNEVTILLANLHLDQYQQAFAASDVDGEILSKVESVGDITDLGVSVPIKARVLFGKLEGFKKFGVPLSLLIPPAACTPGASTSAAKSSPLHFTPAAAPTAHIESPQIEVASSIVTSACPAPPGGEVSVPPSPRAVCVVADSAVRQTQTPPAETAKVVSVANNKPSTAPRRHRFTDVVSSEGLIAAVQEAASDPSNVSLLIDLFDCAMRLLEAGDDDKFSAGVIMDASVAEYIVRGIDAHLDHQELCLHGIHALQYLAQDIGAIQRLGDMGACEAAVAVLLNHSNNSQLGLFCCKLITNLAHNIRNCIKLGHAGVCEALQRTLVPFCAINIEMAEDGCRAISNLSSDEENRKKLGAAGACMVVASILKAFGSTSKIAEVAASAVGNLSFHSQENNALLAVEGVCELIVQAVGQHTSHVDISRIGCTAILNLASNNVENKSKLGKAGACAVVVEIIKNLKADEAVARSALLTVTTLAVNHAENKASLGELDICRYLIEIVELYSSNATVLQIACTAIGNLSSLPANQERFIGEGLKACLEQLLVKWRQQAGGHGEGQGQTQGTVDLVISKIDSALQKLC